MNAPSDSAGTPYPQVPVRADYPAIERDVLARWHRDATFERSVADRPEDDQYLFFDGQIGRAHV